MKKTQANKSQI